MFDFLSKLNEFFANPLVGEIFLCVFLVSEALASISIIKANSIYQAIYGGLKFIKDKFFVKKV